MIARRALSNWRRVGRGSLRGRPVSTRPPSVDPGRLRECPYTAAGKPAPGVGVRLQTEHPTLPLHAGVRDRLPGAAGPSR
jgi:hypothetical protein